jgi:putative tricarboxylic transport membrane protein
MLKDGDRDIGFSVVSIAIALGLLYESYLPKYAAGAGDYGFSPVFFPTILIYLWLVLSLLILLKGLAIRSKQGQAVLDISFSRPLIGFLLTAGYAYLMPVIGFTISSVSYAALFMVILGYRRPIPLISIAILFPILMWYVFTFLLNVPLPVSPWFDRI